MASGDAEVCVQRPDRPGSSTDTAFLAGGGELGARIRAADWSATPLGPPQGWPANLRLALRIMLTSSQPVWIGWGPQLLYFYNDAYKAIIGGKHPWALGRPTREVWAEIWPDISPMLETAMRGDLGTYVESQLLIMRRHGYPEETYYTFSYSPIPDDDGSVGGIYCANSDETRRVIGERQLALLRALAADTSHAHNREEVCDRAAAALAVNRRDMPFAMLYLAGGDAERFELACTSGIDASHPAVPRSTTGDIDWPLGSALRTQRAQFLTDLPGRFAEALPAGPWPEPPTAAAVLPVLPGGDAASGGALVVALNRYRQLDADYRSFLDLVAGQVTAAIAHAEAYQEQHRRAEALAQIDSAKTAFFSNVSHEFRTPLTLMLGPIEDALNDTSTAALAPVQRRRLETAHRNSLRLLRLVNALLDFARIEAGRLQAQFAPTDLAALTAELASNFHSATEKAGLTLRIDCAPLPEPVYVDPDLWEKIVLNLLSNAFKFTFQGEIAVTCRALPQAQGVEVAVSDTGVGIPAQELPRLFERFHRVAGQQSRSFEGSGIGLALVQELVRLHGGTLAVDSEPGRGSRFSIRLRPGHAHLPTSQIGEARPPTPSSVRAEAYVEEALRWLPDAAAALADTPAERSDDTLVLPAPMASEAPAASVLVVDDNTDMRRYMSRLLSRRWRVVTAVDGEDALATLRAQPVDLVVSDVMMPRLDGFGLLRAVRAQAGLRDLPVILLSARAGEDARVEGLDAGADDYLTKPFAARELIARVNANLAMARLRREATSELRESEERFRNMAEHAPVMMWMTDAGGAVVYLNRQWTDFTGQAQEQGLGEGAWTMLHPADRETASQSFTLAREACQPLRLEVRLRRADGQYRWVISAASPRLDGQGGYLGYIGSVIDITERKEAEQVLRRTNETLEARVAAALAERAEAEAQLRQAQKMEAIGRLTGGVAHDFNNVLQVIGGNLQLLSRELAGSAQAEQRLQTAIASLVRGSRLAAQLLAFGRRQPLAPRVVNLGRLLRGFDEMLRRALGEGVEIETVIAGGLWNTFVDPAQVENAVLNLAINARDAMGGHGRLTIEVGNACLDEAYAARHLEVIAGQYVMLAVSDTGCGIPPDLLERVFEPFFTTKPEGQGTGLGLSMVYGFVKQSGGHLKLYSEPAQGTTVRIYLPRSRADEDLPVEVLDTTEAAGGSETVLVVEDDDEVRSTVIDLLSELGYRVLKARDAESALAIIESGLKVDVLFTDVVMPGAIRSPELARRARERLPDIAVLFTSGYTDNAIVHHGRLDEGIELLSKPYTREALARRIRQVLGARPAGTPPVAQRVLVVEDEQDIRDFTVMMLRNRGHSVAEAASARQALGLLERERFDVLVSDLALPGLSGARLAVQAVARDPRLAVVFTSGYDELPEGTSDADRASLVHAQWLRKPFDEQALQEALLRAVRAAGQEGATEAAGPGDGGAR